MPRGRDALTLKECCTNVIARHFDRLWAQHFDKQFGDVPRLLHVIGPFDDLPGELCQEILHTLLKLRLLRKSHLQLLLVRQLTHISFAATYANSVSAQTLEILSLRCGNLVSLNITNCMSLSPKGIIQCISSLPLLRTLVLKQTKINDEVLKTIAMVLPFLTKLDLHACPVTDRGAVSLCGDGGDYEPLCKDLVLLDISATKISLSGCCTIINCFPKLRSLSYPDSVEAVAQLHREAGVNGKGIRKSGSDCRTQIQSNPPGSLTSSVLGDQTSVGQGKPNSDDDVTFNRPGTSTRATTNENAAVHHQLAEYHNLEILYATALRCRRIDPESVALAFCHCPKVKEVYWYQDATDEGLAHLGALEHLCVLEVTSDKPQAVTFHGGVLPLLRKRGEEMMSLGLYDVQDVDLALMGWLCPVLQRLKLVSTHEDADFAHSYLTTQQCRSSFQALQQLTVVMASGVHSRLVTEDLEHLLVNAISLQELHLIEVECFTDQVLVSALSVHGFPCLKQMQLQSCNRITPGSLMQLIATNNPLSHLVLRNCQLVTYHDYQQFTTMVSRESLDLNIEWA